MYQQLFHHDGAENGQSDAGDDEEVPVDGDGCGVVGVDHLGRGLGKSVGQGVRQTQSHIGAESAGHGAVTHIHAQQGMPSDGHIQDSRQGRQDDEARIAGDVQVDAQEHDHAGDDPALGLAQEALHQGHQEAALLRHGGADHRHQHHAQGGKAGEVGDHVGPEILQPIGREQVHRLYPLVGGGVQGLDPQSATQGGDQHHDHRQAKEHGDGIGQLVAGALDCIEHSVEKTSLFSSCTLIRHNDSFLVPDPFRPGHTPIHVWAAPTLRRSIHRDPFGFASPHLLLSCSPFGHPRLRRPGCRCFCPAGRSLYKSYMYQGIINIDEICRLFHSLFIHIVLFLYPAVKDFVVHFPYNGYSDFHESFSQNFKFWH